MPDLQRTLRYHLVDVFTDRPFCGNPLAVFESGNGLDVGTMQAIAREMNLSETVFCMEPTDPSADVRLRIFTVDREVPLAGHPVVGTWHALVTAGKVAVTVRDGVSTMRGQLESGVLPVDVEMCDGAVVSVTMTQQPPKFGPPCADRALVARALGVDESDLVATAPARVVDTGIPWFLVPLVDVRALQGLSPDFAACRELAAMVGTDMFHGFTWESAGEGRPAVRTRHVWFGCVTPGEDPVTGSAAGCIGAYMVEHGHAVAPTAASAAAIEIVQGVEVQRRGEVLALIDGPAGGIRRVRVRGGCVTMGRGELLDPRHR